MALYMFNQKGIWTRIRHYLHIVHLYKNKWITIPVLLLPVSMVSAFSTAHTWALSVGKKWQYPPVCFDLHCRPWVSNGSTKVLVNSGTRKPHSNRENFEPTAFKNFVTSKFICVKHFCIKKKKKSIILLSLHFQRNCVSSGNPWLFQMQWLTSQSRNQQTLLKIQFLIITIS